MGLGTFGWRASIHDLLSYDHNMGIDALQEFVGRQVNVKEEQHELKLEHLKTKQEYTEYELDKDDPVIAELRAATNNKLRIWFPTSLGTMDFRPERCNARIEKDAEGVFRITKVYFG